MDAEEWPNVHGGEGSRLLVAAACVAAAGALVAAYLAAYQVGVLGTVWDPVFGSNQSQRVLHSWFSEKLPIPDAALGAAGYLLELALVLLALSSLKRPTAWHAGTTVLYGALAIGMALGGLFLVGVQVFSLHAFCALCLLSAALSWALAVLAFPALVHGARALVANLHAFTESRRGS